MSSYIVIWGWVPPVRPTMQESALGVAVWRKAHPPPTRQEFSLEVAVWRKSRPIFVRQRTGAFVEDRRAMRSAKSKTVIEIAD